MNTAASAQVFAKQSGLASKGEGSHKLLTWDDVLDLAVKAYWMNRRPR